MPCKKSLLVTRKISREFPNILSADGKYSLFNREDLTQPIQMQLSRKQKTFCQFFSAFLKSSLNFKHFQKKRKRLSSLRHFQNYGVRKTRLDQCLERPVSRDPLESHMVNAPRHSWNLHGITLTIFIDCCEGNWLSKHFC